MIGRRGFIGTLAAFAVAPLAPRQAVKAVVGPTLMTNVLSVRVPYLTERMFIDFFAIAHSAGWSGRTAIVGRQ